MSEAWLRGPIDGVPIALMPVAHSLLDTTADLEAAVAGLSVAQLWATPGGAASVGFHLRHIPGSLERLLTYARGEALSPAELAAIAREGDPGEPPATALELLADHRAAVERADARRRASAPESLYEPRFVGRARLPSSVHGLLFHAAEHSRRHAGQVVATARIVRGAGLA